MVYWNTFLKQFVPSFYQGNFEIVIIINTHIITTLLFIKIIFTVVMTQKQQIKRLMPALTKIIS